MTRYEAIKKLLDHELVALLKEFADLSLSTSPAIEPKSTTLYYLIELDNVDAENYMTAYGEVDRLVRVAILDRVRQGTWMPDEKPVNKLLVDVKALYADVLCGFAGEPEAHRFDHQPALVIEERLARIIRDRS